MEKMFWLPRAVAVVSVTPCVVGCVSVVAAMVLSSISYSEWVKCPVKCKSVL